MEYVLLIMISWPGHKRYVDGAIFPNQRACLQTLKYTKTNRSQRSGIAVATCIPRKTAMTNAKHQRIKYKLVK